LVEESNETKNEGTLDDLAAQYPQLKNVQSRIELNLQKMRRLYEEEDKRIDKLIEQWTSYERANSRNEDRVHISRLWQCVFNNEKFSNAADLRNTETLFELDYAVWVAIFAFCDHIEQRLANALTKQQAQEFVKKETENFGKILLRRIQKREAETKKRWINRNLGRRTP
jgi:hypothetical protein